MPLLENMELPIKKYTLSPRNTIYHPEESEEAAKGLAV